MSDFESTETTTALTSEEAREDTNPTLQTQLSETLDAQITDRLVGQIRQLREMTPDEVICQSRQASQLLTWGYLLRGACASELIERSEKAQSGRGRKDAAGIGITAQLGKMAEELGVSARTLRDDAKIYKTFFAADLKAFQQGKTGDADILRFSHLGRDHFRAVLSLPDPVKFLKKADETTEGVPSVQSLRTRVKELQDKSKPEPTLSQTSSRRIQIKDTTLLDTLLASYNTAHEGSPLTPAAYIEYLLRQETGRHGHSAESSSLANFAESSKQAELAA